MCYAYPGPRCYSHASAAASAAKKKADVLFAKIEDQRHEIDAVSALIEKETENNKLDALIEKRTSLVAKIQSTVEQHSAACSKWEQAEKDAEATLGGIENLRKIIVEQENSSKPDYKIIADTTLRLNNARRYFQKKLNDYDAVYGTVNGKKPSRWGSEYGVEHLTQEIDKYRKRYETLERNDPQYPKVAKKLRSLMEQKTHAMDTLRVVRKGKAGIENYDEFQNSLHRPPGYAGVNEQILEYIKQYERQSRLAPRTQDIVDALGEQRQAYEKILAKIKTERNDTPAHRRVQKQRLTYNIAKLEEVKKLESKYRNQQHDKE